MRRIIAALVTALVVGTAAVPSVALLVELDDRQVQEAIAHGRETYERYRKERRAIDDLDPEYVVAASDGSRALLFTEFASIALDVRRYLAIGRRFAPADLLPAVAHLRGRIEIIIVAFGSSRDFLRESKVRLIDAKTRHEPKIWHLNHGLPREGAAGEFIASGRYSFDARDIDTSKPAAIVLETPEGRAFRFEFDLARLR